jgi:hypothetical protein
MRLVLALVVILAVAAMTRPASAQQGNGSCTALLIGNSNYMWGGEPALKEPVNDGGLVPASNSERGLFVGELLKEIRGQGVSAEEAFNRTRMGVSRASSNDQNPWISSSLSQEFTFSSCGRGSPPAQVSSNTANPPIAPPPPPTPPACVVARAPAPSSPPSDEVKSLDGRVRRNPRDAVGFYRRGQLYARYGDFNRAIADLDEAIRLKPDDPEAFNNRCWARTMLGDTSRALQDCDSALKLRPAYGDALDSRGLINLKLCRDAEALADYESAVKYNPRQASSLFGRGIAKLRTGNPTGGNDDIVAAKGITPSIAEEFKGYGVTATGNEVSAR